MISVITEIMWAVVKLSTELHCEPGSGDVSTQNYIPYVNNTFCFIYGNINVNGPLAAF